MRGRDTSRRVLVVDDSAVNRSLALRQLRILGVSARAACDGREAVEAVQRSSYALILMDCRMPGMSGIDATRAIRSMAGRTGMRTPIVGVTAGESSPEELLALMEAGMDECIAKPLLIEDLRPTLDRWLPKLAAATSAPRVRPTDGTADSPKAILGPVAAELPPDDVAELVHIYLSELPGREAALRRAVVRADTPALELGAHTLSSTSAVLGAGDLSSLCSRMESAARAGAIKGMEELLVLIEAECRRVQVALESDIPEVL